MRMLISKQMKLKVMYGKKLECAGTTQEQRSATRKTAISHSPGTKQEESVDKSAVQTQIQSVIHKGIQSVRNARPARTAAY